jgi:hypothetical protein
LALLEFFVQDVQALSARQARAESCRNIAAADLIVAERPEE